MIVCRYALLLLLDLTVLDRVRSEHTAPVAVY
jgi:hypothetical protein